MIDLVYINVCMYKKNLVLNFWCNVLSTNVSNTWVAP